MIENVAPFVFKPEDEIVIYASLDHVFLQTVVVTPKNGGEPLDMDDLRKWELTHDKWSMNYSYGEPAVWLEPPFNSETSETLRHCEPNRRR